ncbi:MAG: alpha/beta hydrolase-fold protein, partial [Lacipirellulaceae bacterium]
YKYTLGKWSREGADEKGNPLPNFTYYADRSATIKDRVDNWTSKSKREVSGQITGTVKYHRQLSGKDIRPRDVVVWLPPEYDTSKDCYPVLYMHDGQNLFDPKTSSFGVDWQVDETCTRLIETKIIGPIIVVGIYNTPERSREYLPGEKGNAYTRFVASEVKTLIDKEYRTMPSRKFTWVGGSSAGGIGAFRMVWESPEVFSKAICMSPAFKFEKSPGEVVVDYVATVLKTEQPPEGVAFYIDNGGVGLETRLQPGVDAMIEALEQKGFQREKNLRYLFSKEAPHSESAWAKRFPQAIEFLFHAPPRSKSHGKRAQELTPRAERSDQDQSSR